MLKKSINHELKAFSLLEVMVVLFVISIGLLAVISLSAESTKIQGGNKNAVIASQLAAEGIEIVKGARERNYLMRYNENLVAPFDQFIEPGLKKADVSLIKTETISSSSEAILYLSESGFYVHELTINDTPFKRTIDITDIGDYYLLTCIVSWTDRGQEYSYTLERRLYDYSADIIL